ncbi:MAG: hypothetical protein E7553_07905 [Ruminococcaceae bacterium]|nr:hypothetical protein [Oscillospiraceae bacterium]
MLLTLVLLYSYNVNGENWTYLFSVLNVQMKKNERMILTMMKRAISLVMCLVMVIGLLPMAALVMPTVYAANYESASGTVNNATYVLGAGTRDEVKVITDWRSTSKSPTASMTPKYVAIHTTGTYISTSTALANHNYGKSATNAAWHYTVGHDVIYQCLSDKRQGWHVGTSYTGAPSNSNSIGIEMAVNNFPATETYGGEQWQDGDAIMKWWENQFNQTMRHTAMLTVVLLKRHGLSKSAIKMHWDSMSYQNGAAGKDCPMALRASYDPATNTFAAAGSYKNGRDGYFWKMFMGYVDAYWDGQVPADGIDGDLSTAAKIGTYRINSSDGLNVRTEASTAGTLLGALENNEIVEITELASNGWGKVTMKDGTQGWCAISSYGEYIGVDAQAYNMSANSDSMTYSYETDGGLVLTNNSAEQGQFDLLLPQEIGTSTTPFMALQVKPLSGSGYYFGLTKAGSGFWMMRDCNSGDQLVAEESAPYMTNMETLEIDVSEWWKPTDKQKIDQVRFYLAPNTSIKINYFYFVSKANTVTDQRFNLRSASSNINLMLPSNITIEDTSKAGSYKYTNGMLVLTADTEAGFDVAFNVNEEFEVEKFQRWLIGVESPVKFDITLTLSNANGTGEVSLAADYCYDFTDTFPADGYIPGPFESTRGLHLYGYFSHNNVIPANGKSTVSKVTVSIGGKGTAYFNSIQIAENDRIMSFRDGIVKEGSNTPSTDVEKIVFESDVYAVKESNLATGVAAGSTVADMIGNIRSDYTVAVHENGAAVDGASKAKTGQLVKVMDGTKELASYEIVVTGDVNGDGEVSSQDARMMVLFTIDPSGFNAAQKYASDFDENGAVATTDVRNVLLSLIA